MQVLTICLIYSCIIVLYFLIRKIQYNKRQKNVVNFFLYYNNRKRNHVNKETKGTGEIIYLIPPKSMDKKLFPRRKDDAE